MAPPKSFFMEDMVYVFERRIRVCSNLWLLESASQTVVTVNDSESRRLMRVVADPDGTRSRVDASLSGARAVDIDLHGADLQPQGIR